VRALSWLDAPWSFEGWVLWPAGLAMAWYACGFARLLLRSSRHGPHWHDARLFAAGWAIALLALCSPLHEAGARAFSAHMLEHELLMLAAAPLLAFSRPLGVFVWALPTSWRHGVSAFGNSRPWEAAWALLSHPVGATVLQGLALALWHAPALFERALLSEGWHIAQHASFVVTALLFWNAVADSADANPGAARAASRTGAVIGALFLTSLLSGLLGAAMALSRSPWYAPYAQLGLTPSGLTPAQDQQLAGALMWVPGGAVHVLAALWLLRRRLQPQPA
jgi:putative membrane protein